jgi:nitrite reductase/ring-hydroxylating ferredoxin subunit
MSGDRRHAVASADAVSPGERLLVEVEGVEIAVFNVDGDYRAYPNWCAHQGGPACEGRLTGRATATYDRETLETSVEWVAEGETLICPWHDWEYDVRSGRCVSKPDVQLPAYPVGVEDGELVVDLSG